MTALQRTSISTGPKHYRPHRTIWPAPANNHCSFCSMSLEMHVPEGITMPNTTPEQNKALVLEAFDTLFNQARLCVAAERFWSPDYIQHSAHIEPGREGLFNLVSSLLPTLRYEAGLGRRGGRFRDPASDGFRDSAVRVELDRGRYSPHSERHPRRALGCPSRTKPPR